MYTTYILSLSLLYHFITKVNCDTLQFQVKKTESIKLSHNGVFFSYKLSLFYYYYYYFTILYWFCHTSTCIHHGCTCVPHPELPSQTTLYVRQQKRHMYRTVFWTLWEREGGMTWENGIKTYIISYKK